MLGIIKRRIDKIEGLHIIFAPDMETIGSFLQSF